LPNLSAISASVRMLRPRNATRRGLGKPGHVRGERRQNQPAPRPREGRFDAAPGLPLGEAAARLLGVGRVHEGEVHARRDRGADARQVRQLAVRRIRIELEVAGVEETAAARLDHDRRGIGHGMRDPEVGERERSRLSEDPLLRRDQALGRAARLLESPARQGQGEGKTVYGRGAPFAQEGKGADVVLVPVRQKHSIDALAGECREVRRDLVNARKAFVRERDADVHEDARIAALEPQHVLAELAHASERNDFERSRHGTRSERAT
jgi:hypothetical protein